MKLLHTSDWHLGRTLYSKKERQEEQVAFLEWLLVTIKEQSVDLLLVVGDVFDTASPGNSSQKMYYDFLHKVRDTGCKNVMIVGGNHDSPSFLNASKEILAALDIYVLGNVGENMEEEIIVIRDPDNNPVAVVCAVPFLRERDISRFIEGETYADRSKRISENIKKHYEKTAEIAANKREKLGKNIPVIATGHLSVAGGKTTEDDGVRDIYIGNVECVGSEIFPKVFDYVALGHYHVSSAIENNIRYCGSPIPMGFGEAEQKKRVYVVDFGEDQPKIASMEIPVFQRLESIRGDKEFIDNRLAELKNSENSVWVEILYEGSEVFADFTAWVHEKTADSKIEVLKLQNRQYLNKVLTQEEETQSLDALDPFAVFDKLLEKNDIPDTQKDELKNAYRAIVLEMNAGKE
jgi:exonuclease SbcD